MCDHVTVKSLLTRLEEGGKGGGYTNHASCLIFLLNQVLQRFFFTNHTSHKKK